MKHGAGPLILPEHLTFEEKHPQWRDYTPNEAYRDRANYQELVDMFVLANGVKGPVNFLEVRITKRNIVQVSDDWWDDPMFSDKVFWVFHKPEIAYPDGHIWQVYFLEPFEGFRVMNAATEKFGYNPWPPTAALMLPCECTTMAWDETSGGVSDHGRARPLYVPSDMELEVQAQVQQEVRKIQEHMVDVSNNEEMWPDRRKLEADNINTGARNPERDVRIITSGR